MPPVLYAGPRAPEETVERIRELWGLNDPLPVQYVRYLGRAIQGDLGNSTRDKRPVLQAVMERLPATAQLALAGLAVELMIGVPLGITAHRRETSMGYLMGLVVAFFYFLFIIVSDTLRSNSQMHPELLVWFPNVLFLTLGFILFRRLARQ